MATIFNRKGWSSMTQSLFALIFILTFACTPVAAAGQKPDTLGLRITRDPNSSSAPHRCQFWNRWTITNAIPRSKTVKCTQRDLSPGRTSTGDVHGFTFHDRVYYVKKNLKRRGVWTKISNWDTATFTSSGGTPECDY